MPRLPINPCELSKQVEWMRAIKSAQMKMTGAVATDRIGSALTKCISSAADSELDEGAEVLMFREKPIAN